MSNNFIVKPFPSAAAVMHQAVLRAPSGLDTRTIAEVAGYTNYNTMMSELSRQPGHKLGADMLLPLMDAAGSNAPVEFLARERGGVFLVLPEAAQNMRGRGEQHQHGKAQKILFHTDSYTGCYAAPRSCSQTACQPSGPYSEARDRMRARLSLSDAPTKASALPLRASCTLRRPCGLTM